jgi:5-methylcytosine-specific restriction protein A
MPLAAPKACSSPGCGALVRDGGARCPAHRRQVDRERGTARERGYSTAWQKARGAFLQEHPLCEEHLRRGETAAANVVDHIQPHRGDQTLFWDRGNWQAICKSCHDKKTVSTDGGFGHARRLNEIGKP